MEAARIKRPRERLSEAEGSSRMATKEGRQVRSRWRTGTMEAAEEAADSSRCRHSDAEVTELPSKGSKRRSENAPVSAGKRSATGAERRAVSRWAPGSIEAAEEELDRQMAAQQGGGA